MNDIEIKYYSHSEEETILFGEKIGELVEGGQIILLSGDLGVGKTILVQGIGAGLEVDEDITSPTYNLINEYEGQLSLYHMDLYRLEEEEELYDLGFEEYIESDGVVVIEWPDIAYDLLPPDFIYIKFELIDNDVRKILLEAEGEKGIKLLEGLRKYVDTGD
jgi:tRNA threonylcarbamoyladenosine biosynthesis protein TsaE